MDFDVVFHQNLHLIEFQCYFSAKLYDAIKNIGSHSHENPFDDILSSNDIIEFQC